jgi:tRNA-(ms[2]io[6]A)-hydroxylase
MLGLHSDTDHNWVNIVENDLGTFLSDHLYAEQKAASNGFSFVMQYPEHTKLAVKMAAYSLEETEHFKRVLDFMQERNIPLKRDQKSAYVNHLRRFFTKSENKIENLVNRLLIASMIEARSCERFALLSKETKDAEIAAFYHSLIKDEVAHYKLFLDFAKSFQAEEIVLDKWNKFLEYEAAYISKLGKSALVHG